MTEEDALSRRSLASAALLGAIIAVIIVGATGRFDVDQMTFGDGLLHRYVAQHLTTPAEEVESVLGGHGTSIRYSRIGLPVLLWLSSAGSADAMRYVQPLLMVLAAGAAAAAARALLPRLPLAVFAPFAAIGFTLALTGGFAEPIAVALGLWAVVCARRERYWATAALLALAMLTRENAAGILAGLALWDLLRHRVKPVVILASSVVPVVAWHLIVGARFGFLPLSDPWLSSQSQTVGPPFVVLWRALTNADSRTVFVILVHVALAALALSFWRTNELGTAAAFSGVQILWAGPDAWRYIGDAFRLMSFLEVFLVMAWLSRVYDPSAGRRWKLAPS